jgi:3-methyladenine DNA glycosylase AlkC
LAHEALLFLVDSTSRPSNWFSLKRALLQKESATLNGATGEALQNTEQPQRHVELSWEQARQQLPLSESLLKLLEVPSASGVVGSSLPTAERKILLPYKETSSASSLDDLRDTRPIAPCSHQPISDQGWQFRKYTKRLLRHALRDVHRRSQ